jgi:CheY-like chemotaxis protein
MAAAGIVRGASVQCHFSITPGLDDVAEAEAAVTQIGSVLADRKVSLRVLVVEDDEMQRAVLANLFAAANRSNVIHGTPVRFETEVVGSADDALRRIVLDRTFDLVVLDIFMPERSGVDVLPQVRQILGPRAAVVMISSDAKMDLLARCILLGADSYVPKPLALETVRGLWQYVLHKNRAVFASAPFLSALPDQEEYSMDALREALHAAQAPDPDDDDSEGVRRHDSEELPRSACRQQ